MSDLEALVRTLIRRELSRVLPQSATERMSGVVVGVPDTSRYVQVLVAGAKTPVPVWRPALPTPPQAGDRVTMSVGDEGYLVIDQVLDRDPETLIVPDPSDGLTLAELIALGLVDQATYDAHVDSPLHLHTYNTPNTYDTYDGWWTRIGSGVISEQWGSVAFHVLLEGTGSNDTTATRGAVWGRIRQQDAMTNQPTVVLELENGRDIDAADVALVVTSVADSTIIELHLRLTREYEWTEYIPLWTRTDRADWTWDGCQDFASTLPSGTVTTSTDIP